MKNKPWYQRIIESYVAYIILGLTTVSSIAEVMTQLELIPPIVTYAGTVIIIIGLGFLVFWLRKNPVLWVTSDGSIIRIKSINTGSWLLATGIIVALWVPRIPDFFQPRHMPEPIRIGIVAGHTGNDSGAVCLDENGNVTLTEADVNLKIAAMVQEQLTQQGYQVDLLRESDTRLKGYSGAALVSIHADSCEYINDSATGFKVAPALSKVSEGKADEKTENLATCMINQYEETTSLKYQFKSVTMDMREYHPFFEINSSTPGIVIETGFLNLDYSKLVENSDIVAAGIVNGVTCFVNTKPGDSKVIFAVPNLDGNHAIFIQNVVDKPVNLSNWRIRDEHGNELILDDRLSESWELYPNDERIIYVNHRKEGFPSWPLKAGTGWTKGGQIFLIDTDNQKIVAIVQ